MKNQEIITEKIVNAFNEKRGVFGNLADLLENQIPENVNPGSVEHARFYFFLIFNDHGTKSSALYEKFKTLFKNEPDLFNPSKLIQPEFSDPEYLKATYLNDLGLRYPGQASLSWVENARKLVLNYDGEPKNLFSHTKDALSLYNSILKFRSYGPKTSGLLLRVIIGVGFNRELLGINEVPLPVDIHDSRIAFICHVYRPSDVSSVADIYSNPRHISGVEKAWRNAAKNINVEWETIDRALWILGSRGCTQKRCRECPIWKFCDIGKVEVSNAPSLFDDQVV